MNGEWNWLIGRKLSLGEVIDVFGETATVRHGDDETRVLVSELLEEDYKALTAQHAAPMAAQPASDKIVATFRCEGNGIVGTMRAPIHSVSLHDDGVIEVVIDHWPVSAGEEILVNAAHDVYTLPLQPSGLSSGPRFVVHVPGPEQRAAHPAITHCDICGCDWLDNGLNPVGCPYCKQNAWRAVFIAERAIRYRESGMAIEQARIHAEIDAVLIDKQYITKEAPDND